MANFNDVAVNQIFDQVVSYCLSIGRFDSVNQHEPKSAPGTGMTFSVWIDQMFPIEASGLASTTGVVVLQGRVYKSFSSQPYDMIDQDVLSSVCTILGAFSGDFEFGEVANVRMVDLLGAYIPKGLSARAGYVEIDRQIYRVMTIQIPVVVNDMFAQAA